ncbi:hypothetical protein GCM10007301_29420 [Azorhizobium oxalatiphilum]|uniref:Uncharacterized protein n=1 Tax=Azorhizobium oxalatiphilum TaxID=980631 RepID=A0A917FD45_9HYPH|nr:hypothetical protein [Azorhizobium oxalatiphilum]GGF67829.1 hypothetical protein GCM10007301_29420 [Azorhizobium oxalatiphilum]
MNTANLQLEGLLVATSSILELLRRKGLLNEQEILDALHAAEANLEDRLADSPELRSAHMDAVKFPIRFLLAATNAAPEQLSFSQITALVGEAKR